LQWFRFGFPRSYQSDTLQARQILKHAGSSHVMLTFLKDVLFVVWFFLPAGLANIAPIMAAKLPLLKKLDFPLDGYATFHHKRVLGSHKTLRGLISGVLTGIVTVYFQVFLYATIPLVRIFVTVNYSAINPLLFGLLISLGALTGDAVKSFFKRRMNIAPGKSWIPFDQLDYVLGGILFTIFYIQLNLGQYILLFIIWILLHPLATSVGYLIKLKDSPI
jgi:CDP-2,3-bis-(O-geranylgeranyl)-sn-glycerol synthase